MTCAGRSAVERPGQRPDRRRHRRAGVGSGRSGDASGEGRRVQPVLGRADPVRVDRGDVPRIRLAPPAQQEALRSGLPGRNDVVGDRVRVPVGDARRTRDDGHHLGGEPAEVVPRLLVRDLRHLPEPPDARQPRDLGLSVRGSVAREGRRLVRIGLRHARLEALVDEEPPHLLVRDVPDELLDVDAPVAESATLAIRLGDLRLDRDDAFESRLEVRDLAHPSETLPDRDSSMVQLRSRSPWPIE